MIFVTLGQQTNRPLQFATVFLPSSDSHLIASDHNQQKDMEISSCNYSRLATYKQQLFKEIQPLSVIEMIVSTDKTYGILQIKHSNLLAFLYSQIFIPFHIKTHAYYGHNH